MASTKQRKGLNSWGYDTFIGRELFEDGTENFVTLNLHKFGSGSYLSLEQACDDLCQGVKEGEKVLLYQSPGQVGPQTRHASDFLKVLKHALSNTMKRGDVAVIIDQSEGEGTYTLAGRKYEPFKPEQMNLLQKMYKGQPEMKKFPNPFKSQLSIQ